MANKLWVTGINIFNSDTSLFIPTSFAVNQEKIPSLRQEKKLELRSILNGSSTPDLDVFFCFWEINGNDTLPNGEKISELPNQYSFLDKDQWAMIKSFQKGTLNMLLRDKRGKEFIRIVIEKVRNYYFLTEDEFFSKSRKQRVTIPRFIAMTLLYEKKKEFDFNTTKIGEIFKKDHTSVSHAIKTIKNQVEIMKCLRSDVDNIKSIIDLEVKSSEVFSDKKHFSLQ